MNLRLLLQTWRWLRLRALLIGAAALGWGALFPFFYAQFSDVVRQLANSGAFPKELLNFGSGSFLNLPGTVTLGFQHPFALALIGIFAVAAASGAVAGERQHGTLELLLARPISRRTLYVTLTVALLVVVALMVALILVGIVASSAAQDLLGQLDVGQMPLVLLNGVLLWTAFTTFSLAASVSFDRLGPAAGLSLGYLLLNYFLEILGSFWKDAAWTQEYSLFHHFNAAEILGGQLDPVDLLILAAAAVVPIVYALVVFPRRELAAPT
jgi:ABC-2 type transport system permease protein